MDKKQVKAQKSGKTAQKKTGRSEPRSARAKLLLSGRQGPAFPALRASAAQAGSPQPWMDCSHPRQFFFGPRQLLRISSTTCAGALLKALVFQLAAELRDLFFSACLFLFRRASSFPGR